MKLKYTKSQVILEILTLLCLIGMFVYLILNYGNLPDKIPMHYNFAGEIDRWGSKKGLFFMPIMSILLYLLLTVVTFFPSAWNMPVTVKEENKIRVYSCVKTLMILMKLEIIVCFFYITYTMLHVEPISVAFLPIFLILFFGTTAYYIFKTIRLSK